MGLQIHPELRAIAKVQAEPQRRVRRNAPPIVDDLGDPVRRNADRFGKPVLRQAVGGEEFFLQHFAGRDRREFVAGHVVSYQESGCATF